MIKIMWETEPFWYKDSEISLRNVKNSSYTLDLNLAFC